MSEWNDVIGDNIEFTASATGDYTIFFQHNDNTSANDTEFIKYPDNSVTARKFVIRADKTCDLIKLNKTTFTNPAQITLDTAHREQRNIPILTSMVIRTMTTDTAIKVRWF